LDVCGEVAEWLKAAVCKTEICLSDIFDFPRKSFTRFHFTDRSSWLALALETLFWRVAGTIVGDNRDAPIRGTADFSVLALRRA